MRLAATLALLASLLCVLGCASGTLHAWAERPDGTVERWDADPADFHWVDDGPVFWVESPSGIRVYYVKIRKL